MKFIKTLIVAVATVAMTALGGCAADQTSQGFPYELKSLGTVDIGALPCSTGDFAKFRDTITELSAPTDASGRWNQLKARYGLDASTNEGKLEVQQVIDALDKRAKACGTTAPPSATPSATPSVSASPTPGTSASPTPSVGVSASPTPALTMPALSRKVEGPTVRTPDRDQRLLNLIATCGVKVRTESWASVAAGRDQPDSLLKGDGKLVPDYGAAACLLMTNPDAAYQLLHALEDKVAADNPWIPEYLRRSEAGWDHNSPDFALRAGKLRETWTAMSGASAETTSEYQRYAQATLELLEQNYVHTDVKGDLKPVVRMSADNYGSVAFVLPLSYESNVVDWPAGEYVQFIGVASDGTPYGIGFNTKDGNVAMFDKACVCQQVACTPQATPSAQPTATAGPTTKPSRPKPGKLTATTSKPKSAAATTRSKPITTTTTMPPKPVAPPAPAEQTSSAPPASTPYGPRP